MEAAFNDLQKQGKNDVDNLLKWMKDSKVIDASKEQEATARSYFDDVPDKANVALEKFKEVVQKVAETFKVNLGDLTKQLTEGGPKLLQNLTGGAGTSS